MGETKYFTCEEVAKVLGVKTITVWDYIRKEKLKAYRVGKSYRISEKQLERFREQYCKEERIKL